MKIDNNIVKADSGKYLRYYSQLVDEVVLGKRFVCKDGKTILVDISILDIEEVYPVQIDDNKYYISATNYSDAVTQLIRCKYSLDLELALYANSFINEKSTDMEQYQLWRKVCKDVAKSLF